MQVDTNVAEADVGKVRAGMPVTFTVDAHPRKLFQGKVRQVRDNSQTIQNVVTYDAVIDVDNSERLLKPGMTASVTFVHATKENALRLPNAALRFKPDAAFLASHHAPETSPSAEAPMGGIDLDKRTVWVRQGGVASPVTVQTGISDGSFTEVVSGSLRDRDEVVVQVAGAPSTERLR
jgi:HlyD family secretion protein